MEENVLSEFIVFQKEQVPSAQSEATFPVQIVSWTPNYTRHLLDLYKKYKPKVGTYEIRTIKRLWEIVAQELNKLLNSNLSPAHCENRWRVLERAYKKFVENQNKTGQGRKYFEYAAEMEDIFKGKKNIKPTILLSEETKEQVPVETECVQEEEIVENVKGGKDTTPSTPKSSFLNVKQSFKRKRTPILNRNITLDQMRKDRRTFHEEKLQIEKERVEIERGKLDAMQLKNSLLQERNVLLKERNLLLKEKTCRVCSTDFA